MASVSEGNDNIATHIEFMDLLAYVYLQNSLPEKAAVLLAARDVLAPDDPGSLLMLAVALVRASKPERALDALDRLALLGVLTPEFHLVRAQALQALNRRDEAAGAMHAYMEQRGALRATPRADRI